MELNPQVDAVLDSLADLCGRALRSDEFDTNKCSKLVKSLAINGWEQRRDHRSLWVVVKQRARRRWPEPALHRGAALERLARDVEAAYQVYADRRTNVPNQDR